MTRFKLSDAALRRRLARKRAAGLLAHRPSEPPPRSWGFRRCYRNSRSFHAVSYQGCDCLRVELPVEAQAKSSGRLGVPDRNHDCPNCAGTGDGPLLGFLGFSRVDLPCPRCLGSGELKANGSPGVPL